MRHFDEQLSHLLTWMKCMNEWIGNKNLPATLDNTFGSQTLCIIAIVGTTTQIIHFVSQISNNIFSQMWDENNNF